MFHFFALVLLLSGSSSEHLWNPLPDQVDGSAVQSDANNSPDGHNERGILLAGKGDLEGAIHEFQAAVRLKPDFAAAFYNLGTAYISQCKRSRGGNNDPAYYAGLDQALNALKRASTL